jgi:iron complex outermembrane receptor protein
LSPARWPLALLLLPALAAAARAQGAPLPPPPSRSPDIVALPLDSTTTATLRREDLDALGVRFPVDILRAVPGLEVQRLSASESAVSARGYHDNASASQGILGYLDGRTVNNEFYGSVVWDTLPLTIDDLEQVSILRGPASFLFGSSAMHGLVSLSTRSPLSYEQDVAQLRAFVGSYRSNTESLVFVQRRGDAALKLKLAHDDVDSFEPKGRNTRDQGLAELRFESLLGSPSRRIDVAAGVSDQKFDVLIPPVSTLPAASFSNEARELFARAALAWDSLRVRGSVTHFDATSVPDALYTPFRVLTQAADLDVIQTFRPLDGNTLTAGAGYRYARFETEDEDVAGGHHHTQLRWGVLEDEWRAGSLAFTGGLRVDDHSRAGTSWSPRAAVVWSIDPLEEPAPGAAPEDVDRIAHVLRATYGTGFRNPSQRELWFEMPVLGGSGMILGNDDLKPEQVRSFELGYLGRPVAWAQVELTLYYNLIDRLINFEESAPFVFRPENNGKEEAWGGEAQVLLQLTKELSGFANYGYSIRRDRDTGRANSGAPRNKGAAGLRWTPGAGTTLPVGGSLWSSFFDTVVFVDGSSGAPLGKAEAYALVNAELDYRFSWGRLFVRGFNLLDHDHREHPQGDSYGIIVMGGLDARW